MRQRKTSAFFFSAAIIFFLTSKNFIAEEAALPSGEKELTKNSEVIFLSSDDFTSIETPKYISPKGDESIKKNNAVFQQYQKDLETAHKIQNMSESQKSRAKLPECFFYKYKIKKDSENYLDTFNGLYARFVQQQGTIATINRISSPKNITLGQVLILPIEQGLYIPVKAESSLEILLQKEYFSEITQSTKKISIDGLQFYFLPDKNFSGTDIAFFRDDSMQLPLSKKILTSPFGYRTSPISGKWKFHAGIDLAAPVGTEVFACKSGIITTTGYNSTYGNYIIILHNGKKTSLYAHLSKILVKKDDRVSTGQVIGLVGTTGASTGPHLHFEIRENGNPTDPGRLIPD